MIWLDSIKHNIFLSFAETRFPHEMFGMQDCRAHSMHRHLNGSVAVHLQTDFPRRGRAPIPRANNHASPLGPSTVGEGQMQGLWKGERQ